MKFIEKFYGDFIKEDINVMNLYNKFYEKISDSTGTILIYHGKAKYLGKYVKDETLLGLDEIK